MAFDVQRAHRQIPIQEEDWGYLACRLDNTPEEDTTDLDIVYVNTVGTFGVGSAAYWGSWPASPRAWPTRSPAAPGSCTS